MKFPSNHRLSPINFWDFTLHLFFAILCFGLSSIGLHFVGDKISLNQLSPEWFLVLILILGVLISLGGLRTFFSNLKYKQGYLDLDRPNYSLGELVRCSLVLPVPKQFFEEIEFDCRYSKIESKGHVEHMSVHEDIAWSYTGIVPNKCFEGDARTTCIPLEFSLPNSLPDLNQEGKNKHQWIIRFWSKDGLLVMHLAFELPVDCRSIV